MTSNCDVSVIEWVTRQLVERSVKCVKSLQAYLELVNGLVYAKLVLFAVREWSG